MCFQTDKTFTTSEFMGHMTLNLFHTIIDMAHSSGVGAITLASRGEPTLHPKITEMIYHSR